LFITLILYYYFHTLHNLTHY